MRENCQSGFDEREQETEPGQTGLRGRGESRVAHPPGDYRHGACSRLYSPLHSESPEWGTFARSLKCDSQLDRTLRFQSMNERTE